MSQFILKSMTVILFITLGLGLSGCAPVLEMLGEGPTPQPSATPTWRPLPTATATVVPPTELPPAPTATATLKPTALPQPPLPNPTPTPEAGYYGDASLGFGFYYPTAWDVEEINEGVILTSEEPRLLVIGQSSLLEEDETAEEFVTDLFKTLSQLESLEVITNTTTILWNGAEAQLFQFTSPDSEIEAHFTILNRGRRLFTIAIVAPETTFEKYPHTLAAVPASMVLEPPHPYGIARNNALFLLYSQPGSLDPAQTQGSAGSILGAIFSGLVMLDENLQVVPDLAERWEVSEDGTVYTFYLRQNATFHNGSPVTAQNVEFSWERAVDPETNSPTAHLYLNDIVGVNAVVNGTANYIEGLEIIDDHTLQVTIDAPKPYFLAKLTYPTAYIVDRNNLLGNPHWDDHPNGTGPFRLLTWEDNELIILQRYPDFYQGPVPLEHIVFSLRPDVPMWAYENDEIDVAGVSTFNLERVSDPSDPLHDELRTGAGLCTSRLAFDVNRPPFDDPLVRKAFAYAVDREQLTSVVLKGSAQPAQSILPPGMPGYNPDLGAPTFDPEQAQQFLAESRYGGPAGMPRVTFTISGLGADLSDYNEALVDMWQTNLGVTVNIEQLDPFIYSQEIEESPRQIIFRGWCADYPDPENFLDFLYHTDSSENLNDYSNPEVDALLEAARVEQDVTKRFDLYQQAETLILADVPDILLHQSSNYILVKPYVNDYLLSPIGLALEWRVVSVAYPEE